MNSVLAALAVVLLAVLGCGLILWGLGVGFATFVSGDSALLLTGGGDGGGPGLRRISRAGVVTAHMTTHGVVGVQESQDGPEEAGR